MRLLEAKQAAEWVVLQVPGAYGIGIGLKQTRGLVTGTKAIRVYVQEKRPLEEIPEDQRIPSSIYGYPTDVVGQPIPQAALDDSTYRPIRGGAMIAGDGFSFFGTLGGPAYNVGGAYFLMTNFHVLVEMGANESVNDDYVVQPQGDGRIGTRDIFGTLSFPGATNLLADAAGIEPLDIEDPDAFTAGLFTRTAKSLNGFTFLARGSDSIIDLGVPKGRSLYAGSQFALGGEVVVRKRGTSSGTVLSGIIIGIHVTTTVGYPDGSRTFIDQIEVLGTDDDTFALAGDSGSYVLDADGYVVGLYFAGYGEGFSSFVNPAWVIENNWGTLAYPYRTGVAWRPVLPSTFPAFGFISPACDFLFAQDGEVYCTDTFSMFRLRSSYGGYDSDLDSYYHSWYIVGMTGSSYDTNTPLKVAEIGDKFYAFGPFASSLAGSDVGAWTFTRTPPTTNTGADVVSILVPGRTKFASASAVDTVPSTYRPLFSVSDGDRYVYVRGTFENIKWTDGSGVYNAYQPFHNIARYDAQENVYEALGGGLPPDGILEFAPNSAGFPHKIQNHMMVLAPSGLYVGGGYSAFNGLASLTSTPDLGSGVGSICRWDGEEWHKLAGTGLGGSNPFVWSMCLHPDGQKICVAGYFTSAGGVSCPEGLAVYDPATDTFSRLGVMPSGFTYDSEPGDKAYMRVYTRDICAGINGELWLKQHLISTDADPEFPDDHLSYYGWPALWKLSAGDPTGTWELHSYLAAATVPSASLVGSSALLQPIAGGLNAGRGRLFRGLLLGWAQRMTGTIQEKPAVRLASDLGWVASSRVLAYGLWLGETTPHLRHRQRDDLAPRVGGRNMPTSVQQSIRRGRGNTYA